MDAQKKANLEKAGINVDGALERFMNNDAMLQKYLTRFLNEKSFTALDAAIRANDRAGAAAAVHTLKSVCGTIGCEAMQELALAQEKEMRADNWDGAVAMMPKLQQAYEDICVVLKQEFGG